MWYICGWKGVCRKIYVHKTSREWLRASSSFNARSPRGQDKDPGGLTKKKDQDILDRVENAPRPFVALISAFKP
jgi:hypothetical protein